MDRAAVELTVRTRPSPVLGLDLALRLWRLVAAVWLVAVASLVPLRLLVRVTAGDALTALPDGPLPAGELGLILLERLTPVAPALVLTAVASGCVLWVWTVMWHAGVVRWVILSGHHEVRLSEILSRGLLDWWRWARLGLTSAAVLVVVHLGLAVGVGTVGERMRDAGDDATVGIWLLAAVATSLASIAIVWLAGLRGAWLLGADGRRSAVLAWLAGLRGTLRQPFRSVGTLVVWVVPAVAALVLPVLIGWRFEPMRGVVPTAVIEAVVGLITALCQVGLFASFAPVTGQVAERRSRDPLPFG